MQDAGNGSSGRMPALFIEHGVPFSTDDKAWMEDLRQVAQAMPRPKAILLFSPHWQERDFALGATKPTPLIYDFYGFPEKYYRAKYTPPPAPELADRVEALLKNVGPVRRTDRGMDHGAYIPMMAMYPEADVPVLQMALPGENPEALMALGRALSPLRNEGVLILGGGYLIHNLRLRLDPDGLPPPWAQEFDAWIADAISRRDYAALIDYRNRAPHLATALPTAEHFVTLFIPMGSSTDPKEPVGFPITGFLMGAFTRRSVRWG
jgi:4,5-DOPA dioxygenase extradiol